MNPFGDILSLTQNLEDFIPADEHKSSPLKIVQSSSSHIRQDETPLSNDGGLKFEVNNLVKRLKLLLGDFDTSAIDKKLEERLHVHLDLTDEENSMTSFLKQDVSPTIKKKISKFPTTLMQKPSFLNNSIPNIQASQSELNDKNAQDASALLTSNRYCVGLNIFSQTTHTVDLSATVSGIHSAYPKTPRMNKPIATSVGAPVIEEKLDDSSILQTATAIISHDFSLGTEEPKVGTQMEVKFESCLPDIVGKGFMEFSMLTVDHDYMSGKKRLLRANLQPASMTHRFPHDQAAVVDNLHEYIFPYGCAMQTLQLKDWRRLKKTKQFEPKYQIMQFTDASHHIYHAYVIIVHERVSDVCNPHIIRQLEELHTMTLASNTIKRWIRAYITRKHNHLSTPHFPTFNYRKVSCDEFEDLTFYERPPPMNKPQRSEKKKNSIKAIVKTIKHQLNGRNNTAAVNTSSTPSTENIDGKGSQKPLTKKQLTQNEKLLNVGRKVESSSTSTWSNFLTGKKKKNTAFSTNSSESSSSVISSQQISDEGFLTSTIKGGSNELPPTPTAAQKHFFERFSLDNSYLLPSPLPSPSPSANRNRSGTIGMEPEEEEAVRLTLPRQSSKSVWAALDTSAQERKRNSFSSPLPSPAINQNGSNVPHPPSRKNNGGIPPLPASPNRIARKTNQESQKHQSLRKPLKHIRSQKSPQLNNKKILIRQKALCFLTEHSMPSIFFRILESLVNRKYKSSLGGSNPSMPSPPPSVLKKVCSQRKQRFFFAHSIADLSKGSSFYEAMEFKTDSSETATTTSDSYHQLTHSTSDLAMILERTNTYDEDWFDSGPLSSPNSPVPFKLTQSLSRNNSIPLTLSPNASSESIKIPEPQLIEYLSHLQSLNWTEMCKNVVHGPIEIAPKLKASSASTSASKLSAQGMIPPVHIPADPVTVEQWAVSILVSLIPVEVIVHIHSLLLMEKSLLVLGSEASVVSLLTTAFIHLLKPFKWAGVFVPILPPLAQEILDAPVPFIVGIVDHRFFTSKGTHRPGVQISPSASVLYVDDFIRYPNEYQLTHGEFDSLADSNIQTSSHDSSHSAIYSVPLPTPRHGRANPFADLSSEKSLSSATTTSKVPDFQRSHSNASSIDPGTFSLLRFFEPCKLDGDKISSSRSDNTVHLHAEERPSGIQSTQQLLLHSSELTQSLLYLTKRYLHLYMFFNRFHHDHDPATYSMNYLIRKLLLDNHHITRHQKLYQVIKKILELFWSYNRSYCAEILRYDHSWQKIASVHPQHDQVLRLDVEKMLLPMKLTLAFQESVCRTQMFAGLVDQSYSTYLQHDSQRRFLRDWLTYRILIRKARPMSTSRTSSSITLFKSPFLRIYFGSNASAISEYSPFF